MENNRDYWDCLRSSTINCYLGDLTILFSKMKTKQVWELQDLTRALIIVTDLQKEILFTINDGIEESNDTE